MASLTMKNTYEKNEEIGEETAIETTIRHRFNLSLMLKKVFGKIPVMDRDNTNFYTGFYGPSNRLRSSMTPRLPPFYNGKCIQINVVEYHENGVEGAKGFDSDGENFKKKLLLEIYDEFEQTEQKAKLLLDLLQNLFPNIYLQVNATNYDTRNRNTQGTLMYPTDDELVKKIRDKSKMDRNRVGGWVTASGANPSQGYDGDDY